MAELYGPREGVESAAFTPNGKWVVTGAGDGTARIHACEACGSLKDLLVLAPSRVTRELTPEERKKYLMDRPVGVGAR